MASEPTIVVNFSPSQPYEEALVEPVSIGQSTPPPVLSSPPLLKSSITEAQDKPLPEFPLTSLDEVVKSMTDFHIFGDRSNQMEKDQATSPKIPAPEIVCESAKKYLQASSLHHDSHALPNQSDSAKYASVILPTEEGTSRASVNNDEELHYAKNDDAKLGSSSDDLDPSTQPDSVSEQFEEFNGILEKI